MSDHKQLFRQWLLLRRLASAHRGYTVQELADQFRVSQRTIRRDLKVFRDLGFPLESQVGPAGKQFWRLRSGEDLTRITFNTDEAIAMALLKPALEALQGSFIYDAAQEAFAKIHALLPESVSQYLQRMASVIYATPIRRTDYSPKSEVIEQVWIGLEESRVLQMRYHSLSAPRPRQYRVHPYAVVFHRGALYMVAYSENHQELRHFKVDRILAVEVTKQGFRRDPQFNVQKHLANTFGIIPGSGRPQKITVRFAPQVARYVEETQWHPSQRCARRRDGSLDVTFQLTNTEELKRWVMGFGPRACILRPKALREEILQELQAAAQQYLPARSR